MLRDLWRQHALLAVGAYAVLAVALSAVLLTLLAHTADLSGLERRVYPGVRFAGEPLLDDFSPAVTLGFLDDDPALPQQFFSARWQGFWYVPEAGDYDIHGSGDDRLDVWIDGVLVIRRFPPSEMHTVVRTISLDAGLHNIGIGYEQHGGAHSLRLGWSLPGRRANPLPAHRLFPNRPSVLDLRLASAAAWFDTIILIVWIVPAVIGGACLGWRAWVASAADARAPLEGMLRSVLSVAFLEGFSAGPSVTTAPQNHDRNGPQWLRDADAVLFRRVVLLLCLVFLAVLLRTAWLGDDALITFRTVMNVTHGHGLTFNIGERVQSYTHPLWLLLLTGAYLVVGNVYYAAVLVSIGVSLAVFWLALRQAATRMQVWIVVAVLLCSRAFVDYSTSGLENPLSNLLLVTFIALAMRSHEAFGSRVTGVWTVASLLYLTRPDNVLLVAPVLVWLTVQATPWTAAARQALTGLLPAAGWTAFSLIYYGVPFPNTAYAKLGTGIARGDLVQQGVVYLLDSIDRDPVTLVTILCAVALGLLSRGPARWIAGGMLVHLAYVVSIGGDFMSGRFLVLPLLAAVLLLSRTIPFTTVPALMTASVLAVIGLTSAEVPLLSDSRFERTSNSMDRRVRGGYGVIDERAFYFQGQSLLLATRQSFLQPDWPLRASQSVPTDVDIACGGLGRIGLSAPQTHLIDRCALTDPLLARLPVRYTPDWRIGHFERLIPYGYKESVQQATNLIVDPVVKALYADLHVITRAPQLWSRARLAAIWRVNTGVHRRRIDRWSGNPGGALPVIHVEWAATVDPVTRTALERTLGLYHATHDVGNTWQYELPNASPALLRTIVTHALVVDTHDFDRETLVLDAP